MGHRVYATETAMFPTFTKNPCLPIGEDDVSIRPIAVSTTWNTPYAATAFGFHGHVLAECFPHIQFIPMNHGKNVRSRLEKRLIAINPHFTDPKNKERVESMPAAVTQLMHSQTPGAAHLREAAFDTFHQLCRDELQCPDLHFYNKCTSAKKGGHMHTFFVHDDHVQAVLALSKRLLWEPQGCWFAATPKGVEILRDYVQTTTVFNAKFTDVPSRVAPVEIMKNTWKRKVAAAENW